MTGKYIGESMTTGCHNDKRYQIIGEYRSDSYGVIDESGEAYVYSKKSFVDLMPVPQIVKGRRKATH
jgi:hypothetical protein